MSEMEPEMESDFQLTRWADCAGCAAKLDARTLAGALDTLDVVIDPRLLVGPATADDAGVYRLGNDLALVQSVDFFPPVVDDAFDFGRIAAANALSDLYAMGARPLTALNLVAFPVTELPAQVLHAILRGGRAVLDEAGVALLGGHSVVDAGIKYGLAVTGTVDPARIITNAGARPGDVLVLTKPLGVGVITTAAKQGRAAPALIAAAIGTMTRLNRSAAECMIEAGARACTDVTGYGLLGHALELAEASGVAIHLDHRGVPYFAEALTLLDDGVTFQGLAANREAFAGKVHVGESVSPRWRDLLVDPQTSGGLLITVPGSQAESLITRLREDGDSQSAIIGTVEEHDGGATIHVV